MKIQSINLVKILLGICISKVCAFWSVEVPKMKLNSSILPIKDEFFHAVSSFASSGFEEVVIGL